MIGKLPKPEKSHFADKIIMALLIGIAIPAILSSPTGLYSILRAGSRYYFRKNQFNRAAKGLEKKGYIALTKTEEGWLLKLLPNGRKYAKQIVFENLKLPKPKIWDGKWRLFSFDIPEENKNARNMLRSKLKSLGCYNIQRSLFVYPYDCKRELQSIARHYDVLKYTLFAEVFYIDLDKELRKFFHL